MSGYYSIIQYMPRPERHEAVNFGVMFLEKQSGHFEWILTRPIRRIQQVFPGTCEEAINTQITEFYNRVCGEKVDDLDQFTHFVLTREGPIQCTEPEWVTTSKDFTTTLQTLLTRLVL